MLKNISGREANSLIVPGEKENEKMEYEVNDEDYFTRVSFAFHFVDYVFLLCMLLHFVDNTFTTRNH